MLPAWGEMRVYWKESSECGGEPGRRGSNAKSLRWSLSNWKTTARLVGSKTRGNCTQFPGGGQGGWQEPAEEMAVGSPAGKAWHRVLWLRHSTETTTPDKVWQQGPMHLWEPVAKAQMKEVSISLWLPRIRCCSCSPSHSISWSYITPSLKCRPSYRKKGGYSKLTETEWPPNCWDGTSSQKLIWVKENLSYISSSSKLWTHTSYRHLNIFICRWWKYKLLKWIT